jgi:hypothetical protein
VTLNVSFAETFAKEQVSYKLINCWTLNSEIDIYVCNDSDRFQLNRIIDSENQLIIAKSFTILRIMRRWTSLSKNRTNRLTFDYWTSH